MHIVDIIARKRDGLTLSSDEIQAFIDGYTAGTIPDYQAAAWLMAVFIRGMTRQETIDLTLAMANSGDVLDLSDINEYSVDKHSSGGVGDKTSLVVLPLVASCGVPCAKMSGRGLGFSGGTLDKLEAIAGFNVNLTGDQFRELAKENGIVLAGQSASLAPADAKLYALRDVTGTVPSLPLIASSIMSKKIAAGANGIVLDVKYGKGAFMATVEEARALAQIMVEIGMGAGRDVVALISNMNQPLGAAVGNALEVREAIQVLSGQTPAEAKDFEAHCIIVGAHMLRLAGRGSQYQDVAETEAMLRERLENGEALGVFRRMVEAQSGDVRMVDDLSLLPSARLAIPVTAQASGYVADIDALQVARASFDLGAGREKKGDPIDLAVGVYVPVKVGQWVETGSVLGMIHANDEAKVEPVRALLTSAFTFSAAKPAEPALIDGIISSV
ncbi:MAG: thymidine phosphorylase [bacterium]|nr:thymidine phosphorylase [bacterium]